MTFPSTLLNGEPRWFKMVGRGAQLSTRPYAERAQLFATTSEEMHTRSTEHEWDAAVFSFQRQVDK